MNKPLTVEELKTLEIGDWVWVVVLDEDSVSYEFPEKQYLQKLPSFSDRFRFFNYRADADDGLSYFGYGTKWIAYKNKEQAENLE